MDSDPTYLGLNHSCLPYWTLWPPSAVKVTQSCLTLWPHGVYSPWNSPGQNTGMGSLSLLQLLWGLLGVSKQEELCLVCIKTKDSPFLCLFPLWPQIYAWINPLSWQMFGGCLPASWNTVIPLIYHFLQPPGFFNIFICLLVWLPQVFSCSMQGLFHLWHVGSSVAACEFLIAICGI